MNKEKENKIKEFVSNSDYEKGKRYYTPYITFLYKEQIDGNCVAIFEVESERTSRLYDVNIILDKECTQIIDTICDCPQFDATNSCKHIAACLINYYNSLVQDKPSKEMIEKINLINGLRILNATEGLKETKRINTKEKLEISQVRLDAIYDRRMNTTGYNIEIRIGTDDTKYLLKSNKLINFINAYNYEFELELGKKLTYYPSSHYFNDIDKELLNIISDKIEEFKINLNADNTLKRIIDLSKNKMLIINNNVINNYYKKLPFTFKIEEDENNYIIIIKNNCDNLTSLTKDLRLFQSNHDLYELNIKQINLINTIFENNIYSFKIPKDRKLDISKNVIPLIENNIETSDKLKEELILPKNIKPKLYFDLTSKYITCNIKLNYNNREIDYFDNTDILRNKELEDDIINDLKLLGFEIKNKKIILSNIDNIGSFIELDLNNLKDKYDIYTTENFNNLKVKKTPTPKSTFTLGTDNIMSYSFDMEGIKEDEIINILKAKKDKKKYYKLSSGDIVNLQSSKELDDLNNLLEDINIDLNSNNNIIPKYKAIYLDYLKNNKYNNIISTNNLFDELINKFNSYKDGKVKITKEEEKLLRPYQVDGVRWLYNIDKTGFGGILADEMGLGKSIQTIYYIKRKIEEDKNCKILIVAPTSLIYNWEKEFDKFEPKIKKIIMAGLKKERIKEFENINKYNVVITTYGLLREDKEYYDKLNFDTMFIDEAQSIKNINTNITKVVKSINANTMFALTGTPIENSISELWSIFDYIMPGYLPELRKFESYFKINNLESEEDNKNINKLSEITMPFILRRRKKDVVKDLPPKIENNIYVELTKEQKKLYLAELERVNKEMERIVAQEGKSKLKFLILQLLTKLRQLCIDPRIIYDDYNGGSGKLDEFVNVVKTSVENNHKILIFTSFKEALKLAQKELDKENITSYVIDGSVSSKKRMELVEKFNKDDTNVFFIMLKAGGTGLNLTSADIVIHLDLWWNPQVENQATDRAHRIGQKNKVEVVKFITKGTIEEKILELQNKKKILSDKILDENNENIAFNKLTEEDIKNLLAFE